MAKVMMPVWMPVELKEAIQAVAKARMMSMADYVRQTFLANTEVQKQLELGANRPKQTTEEDKP